MLTKEGAEGKLKNRLFYDRDYVKALETVFILHNKLEKANWDYAELALYKEAFSAAKGFIDVHVCDYDISSEMIEAWDKYQAALKRLVEGKDERSDV